MQQIVTSTRRSSQCSFVEPDGTSCKRRAEKRGMCPNHYRQIMRRLRGLKRGGKYTDLTRTWGGPRDDLYIDHEEFPDDDPTKHWPDHKTRWLVFHGIERGGCGASGIVPTDAIHKGDCPGHCRQSARFKEQTVLKEQAERMGIKNRRLFPLTPGGSKAIGDANTRDRIAGLRGITTLPRTKDNVVLKKDNRRGGGKGVGRRRIPGAAAARAKAYRDRKRASRLALKEP